MSETKSAADAFNELLTVKKPNVEHLKTLALLEAAGGAFYDWYLVGAPNEDVRKLLARNGQEEIGHAHRLKRVIKLLHGEDFELPPLAQNPYAKVPDEKAVVDKASLEGLAKGEFVGDDFYEGWAKEIGNDEAARLFRLNGKEEARHGERASQAAALLA
jgi:rubrerythrin